MLSESDIVRFWRFVEKTDSCWNWIGASGRGYDTYGRLNIGNRARRANRLAWEIANGPIPPNMEVRHRCDNPRCVNPEHLELGTHAQNMADMKARGRARGRFSGVTVCQKGLHELSGENLIINSKGGRLCRACRKAINAKHSKIANERRRLNGYWKAQWAKEKAEKAAQLCG